MNFIKKPIVLLIVFIGFIYSNSVIGDEANQRKRNWCPEANLSDAQKESIQVAKQESRQNILDNILDSDEQRAALSACWEKKKERKKKGRDRCPEANLSDAQKESIKAAKQELRQSILDNILESDEQRAALSACWEKRKRHKRKHRDN